MSDIRRTGTKARSSTRAAGSAKGDAADLHGSARGGLGGAWAATRQQAASRPFMTVIGAAAVGAGVGWLLPSGRREKEVMAEVAHKVGEAARDAADTAVEAGRQQVDELTQTALANVGGAVVQAVMSGNQSKAR